MLSLPQRIAGGLGVAACLATVRRAVREVGTLLRGEVDSRLGPVRLARREVCVGPVREACVALARPATASLCAAVMRATASSAAELIASMRAEIACPGRKTSPVGCSPWIAATCAADCPRSTALK